MLMLCSITNFYMQGACINNRNNNFGSPPDCSSNGGAVTDGSSATCNKVFASREHPPIALTEDGCQEGLAVSQQPL